MGWERRNDSWVVQRRHWDGGAKKRLQQNEKAQCPRGGTGWSGVLLPSPASTIPMTPALQERRSQSAASSHLCEMVQEDFSLPESTVFSLLRKGEPAPQAQAPGQNTKQNRPSPLWWKQNLPQAGAHKWLPNLDMLQKQEGNRLSLPHYPPCETLMGTTQPVTSTTPLCSTSVLLGLADVCTEGWDTPCPKTTSGSHGEQELPSPGGVQTSDPAVVTSAVNSAGLSPVWAHLLCYPYLSGWGGARR